MTALAGQCFNCASGDHRLDSARGRGCLSKRDVLPEQCSCWCLQPDHRPILRKPIHRLGPGVVYALDQLRQYRIEVRTKRNGQLVWKPAFNRLPEHLQAEIRANKHELVIALITVESTLPRHRDGWTYGTVAACFGCGKGCVSRDPLGWVRHPWCGWLGQVPILEPIVQVPTYPYTLSGAA